MVKSHKKAKPDLIVDVDSQKLEFFDEKFKKRVSLNDKEKEFMNFINKVNKNLKSIFRGKKGRRGGGEEGLLFLIFL